MNLGVNAILTIAMVLHGLFQFYWYVLLASVIISWVRPNPSQEFVRTLIMIVNKLTTPVYYQVRKRLPRALLSTGVDFSPIIVFIAVSALDFFIYKSLMDLARSLQ